MLRECAGVPSCAALTFYIFWLLGSWLHGSSCCFYTERIWDG